MQELTVRQGDALILAMEGGISISEDPSFRFAYRPNGEPIHVEAIDTEGEAFKTWPARAAPVEVEEDPQARLWPADEADGS